VLDFLKWNKGKVKRRINMSAKKKTRDYTYYERSGSGIVARKRSKKESLLEKGSRKQARDIAKGAKQLW